ncbi:MAG: hypothetical protein M4579_004146 [Chaenotheca gracillima]|nr:MAG: hypothetical protein M4579_004146 [Chaenotheca gracillima]
MFLRRSALTVARRTAFSGVARRSFSPAVLRRDEAKANEEKTGNKQIKPLEGEPPSCQVFFNVK